MHIILLSWKTAAAGIPVGAGHLVVHIGPHKTGTTTFQSFLANNADWIGLAPQLGGHLAVPRSMKHAKSIATFAHTLETIITPWKKSTKAKYIDHKLYENIRADTERGLAAGKTVILSAEYFDEASVELLKAISSVVKARKTTFVIVHRELIDWMRSLWAQQNKRSTSPTSLQKFLQTPYSISKIAERMLSIGGTTTVIGAFFEYLHEHEGLAAFILCNVSQSPSPPDDHAWHRCKDAVHDRENAQGHGSVENVSPSAAIIETVRLAAHAATSLGRHPTLTADRDATRVGLVFDQLPQKCIALSTDKLHAAAVADARSFFEITRAHPPAGWPKKTTCIINETALEKKHWGILANLSGTEPPKQKKKGTKRRGGHSVTPVD